MGNLDGNEEGIDVGVDEGIGVGEGVGSSKKESTYFALCPSSEAENDFSIARKDSVT